VSAVEDVIEAMKQILSLRTQAVRAELDEKVKSTYRSIAIKDFEPDLTEEFILELWQGGDGEAKSRAPMSTGENQILSLSFVGALAAIARDRTDDPNQDAGLLSSMGGVFPIVMDAAFGSLDNNYRRDVAQALPKLAPQIIVLVSKAQGEGPVAEELAPHVGATYVMTVHSRRDDVPAEKIKLGGKSYDYVVPGSDSNWTELLNAGGA
jgi:DNA sulfur modification protein DndD